MTPGATRILVTGSSGMLGGNLVRRLCADGADVVGVDLNPPREPVAGVEEIRGDIRNRDLLDRAADGVDAVVHCAAALPSYSDGEIRSVIVEGTRNVLRASLYRKVPRVVHISSTAVYGLPDVVPTPESYPRSPVDPYSRAKAAAEEVCEAFRDQGLCVAMLRPKTFLGPGRMGLFSMLFEWAAEGRNFPVLGRGDVRIQMFGVDDLVDAVVTTLGADLEIANDTYNLGAAAFSTIREDFQCVLDAAGHGKRVVSLPAKPALAMLRALQRYKMSPVYGRLLHKLMADSYVSIDKARDRLGFAPRLSNRQAILETYHWWRMQRAVPRKPSAAAGRTSRDPWNQGALGLVKALF